MNRLRLIPAAVALLLGACAGGTLRTVPASPAPVRSAEFRQQLAAVVMTPWTTGNSVRTLENGDGYFPPMFRAAMSAKRSITFECYVAVDCWLVASFSRILAERARAGVKVHVILDAFGCAEWGRRNVQVMREAGVQVKFYNPFHFYNPLAYSHRDHRRVLVVDGTVGFCGGAGFAVNWAGNAGDSKHWRDTQYELRGPVVAQLQDNFNDNWRELTGSELRGPEYYPPLSKPGTLTAQMALGSPLKQGDTLGGSFLLAFRAARKSIVMEHSYFIPPPGIVEELLAAAARGVRVQILLPGEIMDMTFAKEVTRHTLRRLMDAGVEIHEFQPTMMHGKLLIVDGHLVIAGSANLDSRSFFINDENDLHVLDSGFAREQRHMFERDLARSRPLTGEMLRLGPTRRLRGFIGQFFYGGL